MVLLSLGVLSDRLYNFLFFFIMKIYFLSSLNKTSAYPQFFYKGAGFGLAHSAAIVAIGENFYKYRSLAFGISLTEGSIGQIAFPWISTALIDHFGWRGIC